MVFAGIVAGGLVYSSFWVVRQVPKAASAVTVALLVREQQKNAQYKRMARMGFDIIQDMEDETFGRRRWYLVCFPKKSLCRDLKFLERVPLVLTAEEAFVLKKAKTSVENGEPTPFNFLKLIDRSTARIEDDEFVETFLTREAVDELLSKARKS